MYNIKYFYTLHKINPSENQYRFYTVRVTPSLFEEWTIVREWGRIGHGGTLRFDHFPDEKAAQNRMQQILKEKIKRGYHIK